MQNKLLGQNFLRNAAVLKKIIAAIDVRPGEFIFEIGPGHGELTVPLAKACREVGAHLTAIEKDAKLADDVRRALSNAGVHEVEIISGDALEFLVSHIQRVAPLSSFKIVGNIPYYLTGHLLRVISESLRYPRRCVFLVQKEVAERMIAGAGDMNRLAASVRFWSEPRIIAKVSKRDFYPQPKVDSAVVALDGRTSPAFHDANRYFHALRTLFAQPRKTLLNNLAAAAEGGDKDDIVKQLASIGVDAKLRPQTLSISQIADIAGTMF